MAGGNENLDPWGKVITDDFTETVGGVPADAVKDYTVPADKAWKILNAVVKHDDIVNRTISIERVSGGGHTVPLEKASVAAAVYEVWPNTFASVSNISGMLGMVLVEGDILRLKGATLGAGKILDGEIYYQERDAP